MHAASVGRWSAFLLLAGLAGCNDPASQRGTPPPIEIGQVRAVVPLYRQGAARTLRYQVATLAADGAVNGLDAAIETLSRPQADATRALLIQMGVDPAHIRILNQASDVAVLTRNVAAVASCSTALQSPGLRGVNDSITSLGRCVQSTNLAGMIDHPSDLMAPPRLEPADGGVSALAVDRWKAGDVKEPPHPSLSSGGGGDQAGGGAQGGDAGAAPQGAAPQSAGAAPANPLLSNAPLTGAY